MAKPRKNLAFRDTPMGKEILKRLENIERIFNGQEPKEANG